MAFLLIKECHYLAFSLSCSSLPVLKCTIFLAGTSTRVLFLGLMATRGFLVLTEKAPKPLISMRSPSASAEVNFLKTTLTMLSISLSVKFGIFAAILSTNSDLVTFSSHYNKVRHFLFRYTFILNLSIQFLRFYTNIRRS